MTQPFGQDFSGTTNAVGTFTAIVKPQAAYHSVLKMVAIASGTPSWLVEVSGSPVGVGQGPNTEIGPFHVAPGEQVKVTVSGGQPNSALRGQLRGIRADSSEQAAQLLTLAPNTIAVQAVGSSRVLGTINAPANAFVTQNFPILPGDQAVGFLYTFVGANDVPAEVSVIGHDTGRSYIDILQGNLNQIAPLFANLIDPNEDTSIDCTVHSQAALSAQVKFIAFLRPIVSLVQAPPGQELSVTTKQSSPAPWQGPASIVVDRHTYVLGETRTLIADPSAGLSVYLHGCNIENANAGAVDLRLRRRGTATDMLGYLTPAGGQQLWHDFKGYKVPGGLGVDAFAGNGQDTMISLDYTVA